MEHVNVVMNTLKSAFMLVPNELPKLVFSSEPILFASVLIVSLIIGTFVLSNVMQNYSQVDRLWSILPPVLVLFFWYRTTVTDHRITIMAALVTLWGVRLTYNFWRKGGYNWKDEDYRWQPLKSAIQPWPLWQLFNLFFICVFQLVLLFLISSPIHIAYRHAGEVKFGTFDALLLFAHLALLLFETIADEQQWVFQREKARRIENGLSLSGDYKSGFLTSGLFQFSRHPNFISEISMWWVFYAFGVSASGGYWLNWTIIGPILLTLLFQGSTNFTEKLTAAKYKDYAKYQQTTSRLLPWIPGHSIHDHSSSSSSSSSSADSPKPKKVKKDNAAPGSPKARHPKASSATKPAPGSPKAKHSTVAASTETKATPTKKLAEQTHQESKKSPKPAKASTSSKPAPGSPKANGKPRVVKRPEESSDEEEVIRPSTKSPNKKTGASRGSYVSSLPVSPKGKRK
jgi:steroid 5-alpha reductase family enzyme